MALARRPGVLVNTIACVTDWPTFGDVLEDRRVRLGLSVRALALKSGVSASAISRAEAGRTWMPTDATRLALARALGVRSGEDHGWWEIDDAD